MTDQAAAAEARLADMRAKAQRTPPVDWPARYAAAQVPVADRDDTDWALADLAREKV
jgi:hypothetical protein